MRAYHEIKKNKANIPMAICNYCITKHGGIGAAQTKPEYNEEVQRILALSVPEDKKKCKKSSDDDNNETIAIFQFLAPGVISSKRKAISGKVLTKYSETLQKNIIKIAKSDQDGVTATFDGWTNVKQEHIWGVVFLTTSGQPLIWGAYDISAERSKTEDVIRHIEKLMTDANEGHINIKAFISDLAGEYAAAWRQLRRKYPSKIFLPYMAHQMNLIFGEIFKESEDEQKRKLVIMVILGHSPTLCTLGYRTTLKIRDHTHDADNLDFHTFACVNRISIKKILEMTEMTLPSVDDIEKKWNMDNVITFLQKEDLNLDLDNDDLAIISNQKVSGEDFLGLTSKKLKSYGLKSGPASRIAELVKEINGGQGKRKAEDSSEELDNKKVRRIGLSPESIAKFLEEQDEVKDDFTKPHELCINRFDFQRKGRDETLHKIYDCIVKRYISIKNTLEKEKSVGDKSLPPILALQATPGGGKSFLLDELAALKSEDFDNYLKSKEQPNRECSFIIGNEVYHEYIEIVNDTSGLVMRILWSYFFDDAKLSWQGFCEKFSTKFESLDIYTAVQSILYHSKKRVFLCVDETMKISPNTDDVNRSPYQGLMNDKGKLIKLNFILTTLDAVYVRTNSTYSGKKIDWVPLRRLEISESTDLFHKILNDKELNEKRKYLIRNAFQTEEGKKEGDAKIVEILKDMLEIECYFDGGANDGKPFESFHCNWEQLYRVLREEGKEVNLRDVHRLSDAYNQ
ncbi:hypothetical protein RhiirA4_457645 [Rhizophagus irregularis]|uniref:DUF659 domain-containing protein n=1 Tax=Rhizophagus irregularis TaxID=588596 RepID=A0A2I1GAG4_9GLOM|nr:hypothetical protein RhiirA4_457645 [Rhizophagus irregularis]